MTRLEDLKTGSYWKHMGIRAEYDDDENVIIVMEISPNVLQYYGNVHGGAIAGLMDIAIAVAINKELGFEKGSFTVEIKINYLRPVSEGTLHATGKVIQLGKNIIVGQGEIKDDEGRLVAVGTATFMAVQINK